MIKQLAIENIITKTQSEIIGVKIIGFWQSTSNM